MAAGIRVLLVDDEPALLEIGKLFLERTGSFAVDTAESAHAALETIGTTSYDAIVSDVQMPEMDGIAFLRLLRAEGDTTPFIVFTGKGRDAVVVEAFRDGADGYLQKGGNPKAQFAELSNTIRQAVSRRQTDDSLRASEEKSRHLIELPDEAIVVVRDGVLRRVEHRGIEFTGCSEREPSRE